MCIFTKKRTDIPTSKLSHIFNYDILENFTELAQFIQKDEHTLLNNIVARWINENRYLLDKKDDKNDYVFLDRCLDFALEKEITVKLNSVDEEKVFVLLDYKLSFLNNYLWMKLSRKEDEYYLQFNEIRDIDYDLLGGDRLKTWLYCAGNNWRFYLPYEPRSKDYPSSKRLILEPPEYEKYKENDSLLDHLGHYKNYLIASSITEKLVKLNNGDNIYLVDSYTDDPSIWSKGGGTIGFVGSNGRLGLLNYELKINSQTGERRFYIEDIQPDIKNIGLGSQALIFLEELASTRDIKYINGELTEKDLESYGDRLRYFYKKNGYTVNKRSVVKHLT